MSEIDETHCKLKKQVTYSAGMDHLRDSPGMNRAYSLSTQEEPNQKYPAVQQVVDNADATALHRTHECENLAETLISEQSNLDKSNIEFVSHHAHLKRTLELDNLNEINNDD